MTAWLGFHGPRPLKTSRVIDLLVELPVVAAGFAKERPLLLGRALEGLVEKLQSPLLARASSRASRSGWSSAAGSAHSSSTSGATA